MTPSGCGLVHAVVPLDESLGRQRPTEDYHRNWDEQARCEQLPFCVHAEPWDDVWLEDCCLAGEWMRFPENVSDGFDEVTPMLSDG